MKTDSQPSTLNAQPFETPEAPSLADSSRRPTLVLTPDFDSIRKLPANERAIAIAKLPARLIPDIVAYGHSLKREAKNAGEFLDLLNARLRCEAEAELQKIGEQLKLELVGEPPAYKLAGQTWTFKDKAGQAVDVEFPNDGLVGVFWLDKKGNAFCEKRIDGQDQIVELGNVKKKAGAAFKNLFRACFTKSADTKTFKKMATTLLGEDRAAQLFAMMSFPSATRCVYRSAKS